MRAAVYMEKCILGQSSWSVEGLGWLDNRLFSTGLSGELIEWDLIELKPKKKVTLTGNGAHCLDIDDTNSCIAVGTVDGYMNTFWIDGDDLNFSKLFDKQEGAIFCCKYDSTGEHIVTGSTDNIRIWNVASGHAIHRMATGRSEKNRETNVWSLVVLKDLTILAGDSRGHITVWNGNDGTRIDSFEALDADVLAVAINHDETMFCCSGVDPKIKIFVPVRKENNSIRQWIRNLKRSQHDHDVKALTYIDREKFISGGVDGYITVSNSTKIHGFQPRRYGAFLPQPCAVVAVTARLLLLKYINYVEVWKLGRPNGNIQLNDDDHPGGKKFFAMDEKQEKLLHLQSVNHEPITCASISPDGMFLFYSTESKVRLFRLDKQVCEENVHDFLRSTNENPIFCSRPRIQRKSLSIPINSHRALKFYFRLIQSPCIALRSVETWTYFHCLPAVTLNSRQPFPRKKVNTKFHCFENIESTRNISEISDTISIVCLSKCEQYFVCAGTCGTTAVWTNKKNRWSYYKTISKSKYAPTAMAIHNKSCRIVLAYSDYKVKIFILSVFYR